MKAKHLVSMLLAGSMILGLAACAPTTNSGGGNDSRSPPERTPAPAVHPRSTWFTTWARNPRPGTPSLTPPAWAAMSF